MHMPRQFTLALVASLLAALPIANAVAEDMPLSDRERAILSRLESVESELARLRQTESSMNGPTVTPASTNWHNEATFGAAPGDACVACQPPACCYCPGEDPCGPQYPTVKLGGFFQADAVWFYQSQGNIEAVGDVQDGVDFRRARLNAHGEAWENVSYMLEMDFAFFGRPSFMDVYLDVHDVAILGNVRVGQWRQPFCMDAMTSVKELTFLERALPFAFAPFRQTGIGFYQNSDDETLTWAASAFRFPADFYGGNTGDSGGYGMATRTTWAPWIDEAAGEVLHFGGAFSFIDPSTNSVQYRSQPEIAVSYTGGAALPGGVSPTVPFFVDTGPISTDNVALFCGELAASRGSAYFQSEILYVQVNQQAAPTTSFSGGYAQVGYFLTGESRPYNRTNGVFGRVKPWAPYDRCGGAGAWEVAGRWSYLDLDDANIHGGKLNDVTAGLNWYLNPYTKFQFNYIWSRLDSPIVPTSDANVFALRAQVDF